MYNDTSAGSVPETWIYCLIIIVIITISASFFHLSQIIIPMVNASTIGSTSCNCVVIRMDDVQDYWLNSVQVALMNLFESKNQSLSLGLIMHHVANDSRIVSKVKEGLLNNGLFELDIHGWDHISYTNLTENEQKDSLFKANMKMQNLFRTKSIVFIPPNDVFNNSTLKAMSTLGIRIISSAPYEENAFNQKRSVFVSNNNSSNKSATIIYHLPSTILFKAFKKGKWVSTPLYDIINNVTRNIQRYGYAVVVIHPQDFAKNMNGTFSNSVDESQISDLSRLMDLLSSKGVHIVPFHKVVRI
jgi:peptidoglycan/xylan/chitin deacetylase (PgdA/CDA1 family)